MVERMVEMRMEEEEHEDEAVVEVVLPPLSAMSLLMREVIVLRELRWDNRTQDVLGNPTRG